MAMNPLIARFGLTLGLLGSSADLAFAAPLANGDVGPASHTDAERIGVWFDRTAGDEGTVFNVFGTDVLGVRVDRVDFGVPALLPASTADAAPLNIPHGTAPTAPVDGDMWSTTTGFFGRVNGVTVSFGSSGGGIGGTIDTDQIPVGTALDTVGGSADFTWTATNGLAVYRVVLDPSALADPVAGAVMIDSADGNTLKWYDGTVWNSAGGGLANIASLVTGDTLSIAATLTGPATVTFPDATGTVLVMPITPLSDSLIMWDADTGTVVSTTQLFDIESITFTPTAAPGSPDAGYLYFDSGTSRLIYGDGTDWITVEKTQCANDFINGPFDGMVQLSTIAGDFAIAEGFIWDAGQTRLNVPGDIDVSSVMLVPSSLPVGQNGQVAYNSGDDTLYFYGGTGWVSCRGQVTSVDGQTGDVVIAPPGSDTQLIFNNAGFFGATQQMFVTGGDYSAYLEMRVDYINGGTSPTIQLQGYSGPGYDLAGRILFQNGSDDRWAIWPNNSEGGSDSGYDFRLMAFGDGGAWNESVLDIVRAQDGAATWHRRVICGDTGASTPAVAYLGVSPATNKPTTVANGDFWVVSRSLHVQVNGVDITLGGNNTNTGLGAGALNYTLTGQRNVAVGKNTLAALTTGLSNMAIGEESQLKNTSGTNNIGIGVYTLYELTTGSRNIAIGSEALGLITDGDDNVAIGENAMYNCVNTGTDGRNVSIGVSAGRTITTGTNNVFLGYGAGYTGQFATAVNSIGLGYQVVTTKSNQMVLGNTSITEAVIHGSVDVILDSATALDFGDPTVDGSWRLTRSSNNFVFERRESGVWVTKQTITA